MIRYKDLSPALKTLVVMGWIAIGFYAFFFLLGFIIGVVSELKSTGRQLKWKKQIIFGT